MKYTHRGAKKPRLPAIDVLEREDGLLVTIFGPSTYNRNVASMNDPRLTFRPATTAESLEILAGNIAKMKRRILDPRCLQAGRIARTSQGVYVNVPLNTEGNPIEDERILKDYLDKAKKVNGIYLVENGSIEGLRDFGFAPYESFLTGVQEVGDFVEGGLARALELTSKSKARSLAVIGSKANYPNGVNVWGFEPRKGEILSRVASFGSARGLGFDGRLDVYGYCWGDDEVGNGDGYAFRLSVGTPITS